MTAGSRHNPHIDNGIGIHRWARLPKQQSSITVYRLPTKGNKLPFSVSLCSKQTAVCGFLFFTFAANKWNLQFSIRFFFYLQLGVHGNEFLEFRGSRNFFRISFYFLGIPQNSVCKIPQNGHAHSTKILGTYKVLREKKSNRCETEAQAIFLNPFTVCSLRKGNFVNCPFVEEETNGSYPFANGLY
jgi:hypothetical protein